MLTRRHWLIGAAAQAAALLGLRKATMTTATTQSDRTRTALAPGEGSRPLRPIEGIYKAPRKHWVGDGFLVAGYFSLIPDTDPEARPLPAARLPPDPRLRARRAAARGRRASPPRLRDRDDRLAGQRRASRQHRRGRRHRSRRRPVDHRRREILHKEYHEESYSRRGGPFQMAQLSGEPPPCDQIGRPPVPAARRRRDGPGEAARRRRECPRRGGRIPGREGAGHDAHPNRRLRRPPEGGRESRLHVPCAPQRGGARHGRCRPHRRRVRRHSG